MNRKAYEAMMMRVAVSAVMVEEGVDRRKANLWSGLTVRIAELSDDDRMAVVEKVKEKVNGGAGEFDGFASDEGSKAIMDAMGSEGVEDEVETDGDEGTSDEGSGDMLSVVNDLSSEIDQMRSDGKIEPSEVVGLLGNMMQMVTLLVNAKPRAVTAKEMEWEAPGGRRKTWRKKKPGGGYEYSVTKPGGGEKEDKKAPEKKVPVKKVPEKKVPSDGNVPVKDEPSDGVGSKLRRTISDFASKIKDSIAKAPAQVKKLVEDEGHRNEVMGNVAAGIKKSPKVVGKALLESARKELKEIKHSGHAVKKLAMGKKLDKDDKHALYATGVYVAGTVIAAATGGVGGGALALAHSFKLHVAIKALHAMADEGFLGFEALHSVTDALGHLSHLAADESEAVQDDEVALNWVLAAVVGVLEDGVSQDEMDQVLAGTESLSDEDIDALDFSSKGGKDKAARLVDRVAVRMQPDFVMEAG